MKRWLRDLAIVALARAAMSAIVWWGGFRAVSDDDFARVVHAQEFALSPALDPTGTSWLPFPFWLGGSVMMVFGTSIEVARVTAFVLGIVASLMLYGAARLLIDDENGALIGALIASIFPWSARLGVATVPELWAGALSVVGLATLARSRESVRLWGAVALAIATLCRYEPWLLAAAFAAFTLHDARRTRSLRLLVAASLAVAGPLGWVAHNAMAHGDALHFVARVSAYQRAVGGSPDVWTYLWALVGYPLMLLREEPELCILGAVVLYGRQVPATFRRPALSLGVMLTLLSLAAVPGGAPTHHGGRAVFTVWLIVALALGEGARRTLRSAERMRFARWVLVVMPLGVLFLRPWYARLDSFITRADEVAIGRAVSGELEQHRALVEAHDYGFFAIQAGSGVPPRLLLDREIDPRRAQRASSFTSAAAVKARATELGAGVVIARLTPVTQQLGHPLVTAGPWAAWRLADGVTR